jgi:hypothetical protein
MNWDDLDAEAKALREAQDAIERQIAALDDDPKNDELLRQHWKDVKQHAERLSRFVQALIRLRQ